MPKQTTHKHHYVPQFILRRWATDGTLTGYYWDSRTNEVRVEQKGASYFCNEQSLYALKSGALPPDALERGRLGHIDDRGAKVTQKLLDNETHSLTDDERADFARLLSSLVARRPVNVKSLKSKGAQHFEKCLDTDPEILGAFRNEGIDEKPSDYYQRETGENFEDKSLLILPKIIDNEEVRKTIINAHWRVYHIPSDCG